MTDKPNTHPRAIQRLNEGYLHRVVLIEGAPRYVVGCSAATSRRGGKLRLTVKHISVERAIALGKIDAASIADAKRLPRVLGGIPVLSYAVA